MFNLEARSFRGASGIWQFMRSTGVRFLTINDVVDERNDPIEATLASAKLLKQNYEKLQSWPLAITAYNHGQTGMFRISQRMNTKDVVKIINEYSSPTFGFASKNFYSEFLAAVEVDKNYEKYFGKLKTQEPAHFDTITLDRYIALTSLSYYTKISKDTYLDLNPGLTAKVSSGIKLLPKGFALRIPKGFEQQFLTRYKNIPRSHFYAQQSRERYHRVRRGDTLSFVAKRYGITVASLMRANRLSQVRFIHIGQVLIIP
ncbi:MAG: LysM peptidoglycan-binding domain-containing protein [Deltaproteobacteria bacterium]|nr:LysM peptidoglycan-binding domain-containing protein [Deltaproteobacteria bacterium]